MLAVRGGRLLLQLLLLLHISKAGEVITSNCIQVMETAGTETCSGTNVCEGELAWCREDKRKEQKCPEGFIRCLRPGRDKKGGDGTRSIPGQCIEATKMMDGKENNCLDRTDENPFKAAITKKEKINSLAILARREGSCTDEKGNPGLICNNQDINSCTTMGFWCKDEYSKECPLIGRGIRTNEPILCKNTTFWLGMGLRGCGKRDGEDLIRCMASKRWQCVEQRYWGIEGEKKSCGDNSDKYRPIYPAEDYYAADEMDLDLHLEPQDVWKTPPKTEKWYNEHIKGTEKASEYIRDSSTGLWMVALSEQACKDNRGFVCKVREIVKN